MASVPFCEPTPHTIWKRFGVSAVEARVPSQRGSASAGGTQVLL
jgi:hypothetical protein